MNTGGGCSRRRTSLPASSPPGKSPQSPVGDIVAPVTPSLPSDRLAGDALIFMLESGLRHVPIVDAERRVLGVVSDADLAGVTFRLALNLRTTIESAKDAATVAAAGWQLPNAVWAMVEAGVDAVEASRIVTLIVAAMARRFLDLAIERLGPRRCRGPGCYSAAPPGASRGIVHLLRPCAGVRSGRTTPGGTGSLLLRLGRGRDLRPRAGGYPEVQGQSGCRGEVPSPSARALGHRLQRLDGRPGAGSREARPDPVRLPAVGGPARSRGHLRGG